MGFDTLKQYKVKIGGDATEFLKELNRLEKEAEKKLKDLNLSDGLRNDIEKLVQEIGLMKKTLNSATDDVKNNFQSIASSVEGLDTKMESLQEAIRLFGSGGIEDSTKSISDSFKTLSDNISDVIGKFKTTYEVINKIQTGQVDISDIISDTSIQETKKKVKSVDELIAELTEDVNKLKKIKNRKKNNLSDILNLDVTEGFDATLATEQIRTLVTNITKNVNKLKKNTKIDLTSIFKGITYDEVLDISDTLEEQVKEAHVNVKKNMPKTIDTDVRFRIKLDEDVDGTATVDSLVRKVNDVVERAQSKVKSIKIPIGYSTDVSNITDQKELDDIKGKSTEKVLFKKLNLEVKANTDNLVNQVNSEVASVNKKLKESGRRIEVEVIGKVNPDTIEDSTKNIAYELEDAQHKLKNDIKINGGNVSIDTSSGIATENTLSDIRTILSQWNTTGIPGTQSEEFKQQLKNKEANAVISSNFDKYFRRFSYKPTKQQTDIQNTTDFLMSTLSMRIDKKEALKKLKRNRNLKKGGEEGLAALRSSDYYKRSKTINGVEYTAFETGTTLKDWQAKLDKMFLESFDDAGKIIGGLFDVTTEVNGKKKKIKGYLQSQIDKVDRDNKSTRESLGLNGVHYRKDKYGKYTDEIIHESGTVTSTEDAYAKTKGIVGRIKADAEAEYRIREAETKELIEQRDIMQQIYDLEQKQKISPLSQEENDQLTSLKQNLGSRIKEISDEDKYNKLVDEQNKLQEKKMKEGLTTPEFNRLKEIGTEIEGLFKEVDDLSGYVVKQMATDVETGLSFIDQRIEESKKEAKEVVKAAQQNIGQVFNPVDENGNRNKTTVQVKSQAQYDYYEKEIKKAQERNSYLSRLVKQKKNSDGKSSFDYSSMTDAEKAEYFSNQKYIQALKARNLVYAEQINLEKELVENKDKIVEKEKVTIGSLHVPDSEKEDYEKVFAKMMNAKDAGISNRDFLSNLSDEEFDQAMAAFEKVIAAIDSKANLSNEEIKALVQNRINEDIAYLRKSLELEEAELIKMEKNPNNYSQKQKDNQQYRVNRINNSIEQLENPNSTTRSSERSLKVHRDILRDIQSDRDNIIQQIKTELGITDEQVKLVEELFVLNKNISDTKDEIKRKDRELNTSVVSEFSGKGKITSTQADAIKNSRTILSTELEELEERKEEITSILSSSSNANSLKQLGILDISSEEESLRKKIAGHEKQIIESLAKKAGLNDENISDLEEILTLESKINKEQIQNNRFQNTIDAELYDQKRMADGKSNVPQSYQAELETALWRKEKSDEKLESLTKAKQEAINRIIPAITNQVKEEIKNTISTIQSKIDQGDASAINKNKKKEWEDILNSTDEIQKIVQQRISSMFEGIHNVTESIEAQMPKDGTQINFGVLPQNLLNELFSLFEQEEILSDAIYQIIARANGSGALKGKHFRANSGLGSGNFDPFDTTYDPKNLYEERSALYTDQITHMDDASIGTAREHLKIAKEVAAERQKEKQIAVETHEKEKQIVAEEQKRINLSQKKQKEEIDSKYDDQILEANKRIQEAREKEFLLEKSLGKTSDKVDKRKKENAIIPQIQEIENSSEYGLYKKIQEAEKKRLELKRENKEVSSEILKIEEKIAEKKAVTYEDKDKEDNRLAFIARQEKELESLNLVKNSKNLKSQFVDLYGDKTGLDTSELFNNAILSRKDLELIESKYSAALSRGDLSEEELKELSDQLQSAKDKFVKDYAAYLAKGAYNIVEIVSDQSIIDSYNSGKLNTKEDIEKLKSSISSSIASKEKELKDLESKTLTRNDGESKKDFKKRQEEFDVSRAEKIAKLETEITAQRQKQAELIELEQHVLSQLQFEKQGQLKMEQQTAALRSEKSAKENELASVRHGKEVAESELRILQKQKEEEEKRLAVNKEIKQFQKGMNAKQKKASLGVDLELIRIQELQEELSKTPVGTDQYKELERQIVEAKQELALFRSEAEELGLTLSETTGRMFLNSDTGITGLTYNGLRKDIDKAKNTGYAPTKEDVSRQKEMSKEQVKSYHYHSDMVDAIRAEGNERKRLWKMSLIAGMSDEQAEVTLEIQKTVASVKDWGKATEEQKNKLKQLHDKAKSLNLEVYDKGKSKNYVRQLVSTKDFSVNPEQYVTNKYLRQMMSSPTGFSTKGTDYTQITNLRLATESTLQNIQNILMTGVKVKVMGSKKDPSYKGKLNKLPDANGDKDPYGYIKEQKERNKNKRPFTYDATKMYNYSKMSSSQQDIAKKFAEVKNKISQNYSKELGLELHSIIEEAKKAGLSYSKRKKNLYLNDKNVDKNAKKTDNVKDNKKNNSKAKSKNKKQSESKEAKNRLKSILNNVEMSTEEKQKAIDEVLARKWNIGKAKDGSYFVGGYKSEASLDITKEYAKKHGLVVDESKIGSLYKKDSKGSESQEKSFELALKQNTEQQNNVRSKLENIESRIVDAESKKSSEDLEALALEKKNLLAEEEQLKNEFNEILAKISNEKDDSKDGLKKTETPVVDDSKKKKTAVKPYDFDVKDLTEEELKKKLRIANAQITKGSSNASEWEKKKSEIIARLEEIQQEAKETTQVVESEIKEQAKVIDSVSVENNVDKNNDTKVTSSEEQKINEETSAIKEQTEAIEKQYQVEKSLNQVNAQLRKDKLSDETRNKWTQIAKFNGYEIDPKSGLAIEKVADAIEEVTESQEKLNEETLEYKTIQELAYEKGLSKSLDISKTTSFDEKGQKKILYTATDVYGNSIKANEFGEVKQLTKVKEVIQKDAQELKKLMSDVSNTLSNNSVKEIYSYMPELLPASEKEKVLELRNAYESLDETLESFRQEGKEDFSKEELESIVNQIGTINKIKAEFSGDAINLGKIDTLQAKNLQTTLQQLAVDFEEARISNVRFNKNNKEMTYQLVDSNKMLNTYRLTVDKTGEVTRELVQSEKYLNPFQKMLSTTGRKFGELFNYAVASTSIYEVFNFFRRGVTIVQEFDAAMTELAKVSKDSELALSRFGKEAYNIAQQIGSTGVEIINSASDWARLGYAIDEASELAKNSALYANVGDMDIDTATEHMVSTLKAFNIEASDSISIVDKFNEVGNNYAISSAGIGEALERSASSLVAAGNDINQSIALITAGNVVSQDPESVGNAIKVLSLRIRGSKTELEAMGEETDGLASSSSKLREEIEALTGVDIMLDDSTYKDTYDILLEISKVWDQLSDVSQANVLEKLAGKTRASVVAGLLQQGETLEDVYESSINAAGSATKENEKYKESIQGHLDLLTNQWQSTWTSDLNREFINGILDIGTALLKVVDDVGLVKTAFIGLSGVFVAKNFGGGRDKKFSLVIKYATESFSLEVCEFWCTSE